MAIIKKYSHSALSNQANENGIKKNKGIWDMRRTQERDEFDSGSPYKSIKGCSLCKFLHEIEIKFYCGNNKDIVGFMVFAVLSGNGDFNSISSEISKVV